MGSRVRALIIVLLVGLSGIAVADTGGRIGGGDWDSPSSSSSHSFGESPSSSSHAWSSSSSSSSSDWSWHSSSSPSNYSYSSRSSTTLPPWMYLVLIVGALIVGAVKVMITSSSSPSYDGGSYGFVPSVPFDAIDVTVLRIAVDGRARKFVQTEIARVAKLADTATAEGRATMLREVTLMLRRIRDAWVYGGAINEPMRSKTGAKATFDRHVDDARAKFMTETISNVQGTTNVRAAGEYTPRSEEGEGVILVTIVVAARGELFTVAHIGDGEDLRKALEAASHRSASDLVAIDIIWQPSEENDRMSSIELVAKYPQPELIPIRGALVGKTFCTYCSGPFPAELVSCPHCGAPARSAA